MSRGQLHLPQQPGNRADAQTVHRIFVVHQPHDLRFGAVDLVARRRIAGLANIAVAIGRAAQNRDFPGLGAMALAAAGSFEDLRTLIFGDHALELQHQLIFRRAGTRRLEECRLNAVAGKLLGQQDLVGIFAAQPVRRVDQDSLNMTLGGQIAQPFAGSGSAPRGPRANGPYRRCRSPNNQDHRYAAGGGHGVGAEGVGHAVEAEIDPIRQDGRQECRLVVARSAAALMREAAREASRRALVSFPAISLGTAVGASLADDDLNALNASAEVEATAKPTPAVAAVRADTALFIGASCRKADRSDFFVTRRVGAAWSGRGGP